MNVTEAAKSVIAFSAQCPPGTAIWPCLVGDTGTGKTSRVRTLAQELGVALEVVLLGTELPHDVLGLPRIRGGAAAHLVHERWVRASERPTLIFLDEIDKVDRDTAAAVLTLLADRRVYGLALHPQTVIVAAMQPPADLALWTEDPTFRALAARLCFLPVSKTEAWRFIENETGLDFAPIYGEDGKEDVAVPVLPRPSPRQVLWLTRFALNQTDPMSELVRTVGRGIIASPEALEEHLRLLTSSSASRLRIAILAKDETAFISWIADLASLADLVMPVTVRELFVAQSPRPFVAAVRRLWDEGSENDRMAFLKELPQSLDKIAAEQGTPGQAQVFGHATPEEVVRLLMEAVENLKQTKQKRGGGGKK